MDEQTKVRAALARLSDLLAGIARTADEKNRERCPYKAADLRCTYAAGCRNQHRGDTMLLCGGDEFVRLSSTSNS